MITLLIDKLSRVHHHVTCDYNPSDHRIFCPTRRKFMSCLARNFIVIAADAEDKTISERKVVPTDGQTEGQTEQNVYDLKSREIHTKLKTMSVLESIQYLWNRKLDKNDPNYMQQFEKPGETGADRIRLMLSEYFNGEDNPEMNFIVQSGFWGFLVGGLYGGIVSNQTALFDFMRRHNEYVFRGDIEGKRKIRDTMYIQFCRQGFRWAWRVGLFTATLTGLTTSLIAYRNDVHLTDCMLAGALVCSFWKAKLGLRAMVVSGLLGSVFGTFFGGSVKLMLWTFNTSVPEYRHWRHMRYRGYLEPEIYSDGSTEFGWSVEGRDPRRQPDYRSETPNLAAES